MILLGSEIISALKTHMPDVSVSDAYSVAVPKCPQLVIDERPGNDGAYIDGLPCVTRNLITLEVYAKDMMISGVPTKKRDAALKFLMEADSFLNERFGLTMTGNISIAPYEDQTIFRAVANYTVYIDKRTNHIYRRVKNYG